jgi:hypothetical protein
VSIYFYVDHLYSYRKLPNRNVFFSDVEGNLNVFFSDLEGNFLLYSGTPLTNQQLFPNYFS